VEHVDRCATYQAVFFFFFKLQKNLSVVVGLPFIFQLGHMKTNKNCPKYGKEPETPVETTDLEKASRKSTSQDLLNVSQHKLQKKRMVSKSATKVEVSEGEKSSLAKSLPVKFKCGSTEKFSDKPADGAADHSDQPTTSDVRPVSSDIDTGSRSTAKVNKIKIFNKAKPENIQVESHKPSIVIRPPMDIERSQIESHKPSIVIRPPTYTDRNHVDPHKPSIVIRPPAEKDREKTQKKIVIKQSKEIIDPDRVSQDGRTGREHRKTKKIAELSSFEKHGKTMHFSRESAKRKAEDRSWWEEEEKRRTAERLREERARRIYAEEMRSLEEQEKLADIKRYTETIRWDWDEEERQKAKKKKKKMKMKKPEISDDYLDDYRGARNGRRMPERDRGAKRRPVVDVGTYGADYTPATKRRRVGEVLISSNLITSIWFVLCIYVVCYTVIHSSFYAMGWKTFIGQIVFCEIVLAWLLFPPSLFFLREGKERRNIFGAKPHNLKVIVQSSSLLISEKLVSNHLLFSCSLLTGFEESLSV
jgi:transcription initiation factor TFIID subunit 1